MLVFPAGSGLNTTRDCPITLLDDSDMEDVESIELIATASESALLFQRITINIIDNDGKYVVLS